MAHNATQFPAHIYSFDIEFIKDGQGRPLFASFPFIIEGSPIKGISCAGNFVAKCGISSRFAGDMKHDSQNQNRLSLFAELGLMNVYGLNQIHSHSVLAVDRDNPPAVAADGMVTQDRNITLSVTVADCLPVYLFDTISGAFGLVHSGWKGTGIAAVALNLMQERWGTKPSAVAAVLGPCIDSCCYKVAAERAKIFEKEFGAESVRKQSGEFFLDLKAANIKLLSEAGVKNIAVCRDCTFTDERLGSFRREGEGYTRMAAMIGAAL